MSRGSHFAENIEVSLRVTVFLVPVSPVVSHEGLQKQRGLRGLLCTRPLEQISDLLIIKVHVVKQRTVPLESGLREQHYISRGHQAGAPGEHLAGAQRTPVLRRDRGLPRSQVPQQHLSPFHRSRGVGFQRRNQLPHLGVLGELQLIVKPIGLNIFQKPGMNNREHPARVRDKALRGPPELPIGAWNEVNLHLVGVVATPVSGIEVLRQELQRRLALCRVLGGHQTEHIRQAWLFLHPKPLQKPPGLRAPSKPGVVQHTGAEVGLHGPPLALRGGQQLAPKEQLRGFLCGGPARTEQERHLPQLLPVRLVHGARQAAEVLHHIFEGAELSHGLHDIPDVGGALHSELTQQGAGDGHPGP
eukprot:RCo008948